MQLLHSSNSVRTEQPTNWPGAENLPTGLADSNDSIRQALLNLCKMPGVERVVLLRANGGLFCGKNDAGREDFSRTVQQMTLAARRAARRMGLGAIESVTLEGPEGSIVVAAGHSVGAAECGVEVQPEFILKQIEPLVGLSERKGEG